MFLQFWRLFPNNENMNLRRSRKFLLNSQSYWNSKFSLKFAEILDFSENSLKFAVKCISKSYYVFRRYNFAHSLYISFLYSLTLKSYLLTVFTCSYFLFFLWNENNFEWKLLLLNGRVLLTVFTYPYILTVFTCSYFLFFL